MVGQSTWLLLMDRFREQARSYNWIGGSQFEVGWLSGRLREQARSHSGIGGGQLGIGWLVGRHREQAHSYRWNTLSCRSEPARESDLTVDSALSVNSRHFHWELKT